MKAAIAIAAIGVLWFLVLVAAIIAPTELDDRIDDYDDEDNNR